MSEPRIEAIIEEILKLMNVSFDSVEKIMDTQIGGLAEKTAVEHARYSIQSADSPILIGSNGENLNALNYIVRRIVAKATNNEENARFLIDVNDYHDKALEAIRINAKIMAERVLTSKTSAELEPMSSYERMCVHKALSGLSNIKTESKGDGSLRRLVIKYVAS